MKLSERLSGVADTLLVFVSICIDDYISSWVNVHEVGDVVHRVVDAHLLPGQFIRLHTVPETSALNKKYGE